MFTKLRLLLARIIAAATTQQSTQNHPAENTAATRYLQRLALSNHCYLTGYELMPRKFLNQRQRRKRCRQAGTY